MAVPRQANRGAAEIQHFRCLSRTHSPDCPAVPGSADCFAGPHGAGASGGRHRAYRLQPWQGGHSMSETTVNRQAAPAAKPAMGVFERFLTVWVALCIIAGIVLG